jgi:1-acyl-sn-glycerol-3-phosphate acyltransferase
MYRSASFPVRNPLKDWQHIPARDQELTLLESLTSTRRESGLLFRTSHYITWSVLKAYLRLAHGFSVTGQQNIPSGGPFILIANHSSHLDTIALAAALPSRLRSKVIPIAAGDTFFSSTSKSLLTSISFNALPMWRKTGSNHALQELRSRLLESDSILILFPEGTRSRDGNMATFKPGIGAVVAETDIPVIPCFLTGCYQAFPADAKRPAFTPVTLAIGTPQTFESVENSRVGWEQITALLEENVLNLQKF